MKMKNIRFITSLVPASMLLLASCIDDELPGCDYTLSGEDVTVSVNVQLPAMDVQSRAALSDQQINEVRSLWIRTYSAVTKEATSDWLELSPGTHDTEVERTFDIKTKSGSSYIVAVANVENPGVTKDEPFAEPQPLSTLLKAADTWDAFLSIAAVSPSTTNDVNAAPLPLTMSGCLSTVGVGNTATHPRLEEWGDKLNFEPIFIPATSVEDYQLSGAIHLRRLVSHVSFNITAGPNVSIQPTSYTIVNVPTATWLYERGGDAANFGHDCTEDNSSEYFATPQQFTSQYFTHDGDTYKFDFWQGENKHEALADAGCDSYEKREIEAKALDGANSGLYISLTGETWTPDNMASYVVVRCNVDYKDVLYVDENGNTLTEGQEVTRTGSAEYVIHLGYLENDASDFNCYRNVDYTYNMTINGVNDIRLEAFGAEQYPGAEGMVSDVENATVFLDAHYAAFNIQLTKEELKNVNPGTRKGFGYIITSWDNGREYTFTEEDNPTAEEMKYINWVQLRPTTSMSELAEYRPMDKSANDDGRTFTLADAAGARLWEDDDRRFSAAGIYTVFVNEYTYEDDADEGNDGGTPNWARYVNQNPRRFYIRVTKKVSDDAQSVYARSKYAVAQSSIQTYYSMNDFTPSQTVGGITLREGTAIGVERVNETEGLNLRSSFAPTGPSAVNGRWNVWQWLIKDNNNPRWSSFVTQSAPQTIPAVKGNAAQNGPELEARTESLPRLAYFDGDFTGNNARFSTDPQPNSNRAADYIEAINACMNRNRDNNGNGIIDPEELRWYVPATGKYLRVVLGSQSLPDPLMDYREISQLPNTNNGDNTRYLFFTSTRQIMWAMEGMSLSNYGQYCKAPWQVRCIRNLGSDMRTIDNVDKVVQAYEHDADNKVVRMTYYDANSVRTITYSGNGNGEGEMPVHLVNSQYNMPYKAFQYQVGNPIDGIFNANTNANKDNVLKEVTDAINNNPCKDLGTGWRIPNQKELAIMRNLGVVDINEGLYVTSCTVSYFNKNSMTGGTYTPYEHLFMGARSDASCQCSIGDGQPIYIRCVRDYIE